MCSIKHSTHICMDFYFFYISLVCVCACVRQKEVYSLGIYLNIYPFLPSDSEGNQQRLTWFMEGARSSGWIHTHSVQSNFSAYPLEPSLKYIHTSSPPPMNHVRCWLKRKFKLNSKQNPKTKPKPRIVYGLTREYHETLFCKKATFWNNNHRWVELCAYRLISLHLLYTR